MVKSRTLPGRAKVPAAGPTAGVHFEIDNRIPAMISPSGPESRLCPFSCRQSPVISPYCVDVESKCSYGKRLPVYYCSL